MPASGSVRLNLAVSNEKKFALQSKASMSFPGMGILEQAGTSGENIETGTDTFLRYICYQGTSAVSCVARTGTFGFETEGFYEYPGRGGYGPIASILSTTAVLKGVAAVISRFSHPSLTPFLL